MECAGKSACLCLLNLDATAWAVSWLAEPNGADDRRRGNVPEAEIEMLKELIVLQATSRIARSSFTVLMVLTIVRSQAVAANNVGGSAAIIKRVWRVVDDAIASPQS